MTYSTLTRRTPLRAKPKQWVKPERRIVLVRSTLPVRRAVMATDFAPAAPVPKRAYVRSAALREAYRLIPCQFDEAGVICGRPDTCCCHSNLLEHGKGRGIKADDSIAAAGCVRHHYELDQGKTWSKQERRERFERAHQRSVALLLRRGLWPASVPAPFPEAACA